MLPGLVRCSVAAVASTPHGLRSALQHLGQSEVQDLHLPALGYEDIRRLDVAVENAFRVRGIQCVGNLDTGVEQGLGVQRPARDVVLEGLAIQELHGDEGLARVLSDLVDGADVGVVERRGGLGFAPEAFQRLLVLGHAFGEELQGNKTV